MGWRMAVACCVAATIARLAFSGGSALPAVCSPTSDDSVAQNCSSPGASSLLLIGIKTDVVHGAAARQAIRETWGHPQTAPHGVRVLFLGCEAQLQREEAAAIETERQTFGDLLTHELDCVDGYDRLVDKALAFFRHASSLPHRFVMLADDDIYLRTDRLVEWLRCQRPERFYAGQVWSTQFRRAIRVQRDPRHRHYLSRTEYPRDELPPFANGPHVVVSADCAAFIARQQQQLRARALGAMDDVSLAWWLQLLHVRPLHLPEFLNLRDSLCHPNAVSIADVSPEGVRRMHANVVNSRGLCAGFSHSSWVRPTRTPTPTPTPIELAPAPAPQHFLSIDWTVELVPDVPELQIATRIRASGVPDVQLDALFVPSGVSFFEFCRRVDELLREAFAGRRVDLETFCASFKSGLSAFIQRSVRASPAHATLYALPQHNLEGRETDPVVVVAYSPMASLSKLLLECLFAQVFPHAQVLLLPADDVLSPPAVLVFSLLDGNCSAVPDTACLHERRSLLDRYDFTTRLVLLAGEPWPVPDELQARGVITLSTTLSSTGDDRAVYLPQASASFGERLSHRPHDLLAPSPAADGRRFCAYLYARCDRPQREYMFDLLNAHEPVDALGACQGAGRAPNASRRAHRFAPFFNDDAVALYAAYRFVLAFENADAPGYVTEKIVNAFLAGSVPVFHGHSRSAAALFNPQSFIDCGAFRRLRDCAAYVLLVHRNASLYASYRGAAPIRDRAAFERLFSWHPAVASSSLADRVRRLLDAA
ncbi:hypothetical protein ATCC90586_004354 [Pythium insidiosum]|nr:hypothetical protein ATCC90586_004354 [Pythium insidiosum]